MTTTRSASRAVPFTLVMALTGLATVPLGAGDALDVGGEEADLAALDSNDGAMTRASNDSTATPKAAPETSPEGWRAALVAELMQRYDAREADAAAAPPEKEYIFLRAPVDPDVVVLEPITVTERFDTEGFERAMAQEYGRTRATQRRWGTGVLMTRDIGKVRVGVFSILYVPVMFGASW